MGEVGVEDQLERRRRVWLRRRRPEEPNTNLSLALPPQSLNVQRSTARSPYLPLITTRIKHLYEVPMETALRVTEALKSFRVSLAV